jgi:D-amino-acid dehydrogenase
MTQERTESYRVGVIGGGVVALCSAFYLQRQGHEVTIFEKEALGSGASRGNGGQIVTADPLPAPGMVREGLSHWLRPSSAFYIHPRSLLGLSSFLTHFALNANSRTYQSAFNKLDQLNRLRTRLFDELAEEGIGDHFVATGNLRAFSVRETALRDWQAARKLAALGLTQEPGDFLDTRDLHAIEPSLGAAARWGFLRPDVRFGDPSRFVDQLSQYLSDHGVRIVEQTAVSTVAEKSGSVVVHHDRDGDSFDRVLIAAGLGSGELLHRMGARISLVPGKGYSFTVQPAEMPRYTVLLGEAHVGATPLDDVRLRIAGTMELGATANGSTAGRIDRIVEAAAPFLDGIDWSNITEEWSGSRPMTPDGLPYIGRLGRSQRIFVATGHNMLGLSLAPATGHEISRLITGDSDDASLAPFALNR